MKRTYSNTRKISLYVSLISGFLAVFFSVFSLLHPEIYFHSIVAVLAVFVFALDLLISMRVLLVSSKKFSLIHAWCVSLVLVAIASVFALSLTNENARLVFELIADGLVLVNAFVAVVISAKEEPSVYFALFAFIPIAAMIFVRIYLGHWFLLVLASVGLFMIVFVFISQFKNSYIKTLLLLEGLVLISISLIAFFMDLYEMLFPIVRVVVFAMIYLFAAFSLETPKDELPVMVPKSAEDLWAEKYLRMLSKKYKSLTEEEMLSQPVSALKTLTEDEAKLLGDIFGIVTVRDLAVNPYFNMSKEILDEAKLLKK